MTSHRARPAPVEELAADRRREKRLFWKGLLAVAVVVVVAVVRQRYLL